MHNKAATSEFDKKTAKKIARDVALFRGPVFGYPPVLLWSPISRESITENWARALSQQKNQRDRVGIFINIPFCDVLCRYCDYVTTIGMHDDVLNQYPDKLEEEIRFWGIRPDSIDSIYLSGGNMALFPPQGLERIFSLIDKNFTFAPDALRKVGLSHSPLSSETAAVFRDWMIRETVIQVQTLDPEFSKSINRVVRRGDLARTCAALRKAGITHIKIDWMVGLPGQTPESFGVDMDEISAAEPDEIIVTPFHPATYSPVGPLLTADWKPRPALLGSGDVVERSAKVKMAYEFIANYSKAKRRDFWRAMTPEQERQSTLGLGYGALSHIFGRLKYTSFRFKPRDPDHRTFHSGNSDIYGITMSAEREMYRHLIERITDRGEVDEKFFKKTFGIPLKTVFGTELARLELEGILDRNGQSWRVRQWKKLIQSVVAASLYEPEYKSFFQKRFENHPEFYNRVDRDLIEIYGI